MKYFLATILTKGEKKDFPIYANDKNEASNHAKLKYAGIIIKVQEAKEPLENQLKRFKTNFLQNIKKRKIPQDALIASVRQMSVMTNAGISIHDSIIDIANATDDSNLKYVFKKVADDINSGYSLSSSMENFSFELGSLTIAMVQLGEKTGNIDESLNSLADMLEDIRSNVIKFKKAMAYPRNVMIAMAIAFIILISYVVPQFKSIFEELNADLPIPTQILLTLEHIVNNYGAYALSALVLIFFTIKYFINTDDKIKLIWHKILLNIYLINSIIKYATLSRFTLVFSKLIKAGIPIADALDTSASMIDNLVLKQKLLLVKNTVEKGGALNKGLEETKLFDNMIIKMIYAGEESGAVDTMSEKVANYFKMKFDNIIDGLSGAIEPIMLFIIASMVILLALGIFMPMWEMGNVAQGR